jgi:hypothetical protein
VKTKMFEFTGIASCCPTGLSSYWLMCLHSDSKWDPVTGHLNWHRVNGPSLAVPAGDRLNRTGQGRIKLTPHAFERRETFVSFKFSHFSELKFNSQ